MRRIKSTNTKPEMVVRRLVHALGYRYRLHKKDLPGKPDLVFATRRKAILVHGCFWHGHEADDCSIRHAPKSNTGYWSPKLARNKQRDDVNAAALADLGWDVLTVWECQTKDLTDLEKRLRSFLAKKKAPA